MRAITFSGLLTVCVLALAAMPPVAGAQGHLLIAEGKGKDKDKGGPPGNDDKRQSYNQGQFAPDHRGIIVGYYQQQYYGRGDCPPGLAKKNNGCLPPGQAKKLYAVGQPWPATLVFQPLPGPLITQLGPPPSGYGYGYYGGDVIMYALVGKVVVDIVSTLTR